MMISKTALELKKYLLGEYLNEEYKQKAFIEYLESYWEVEECTLIDDVQIGIPGTKLARVDKFLINNSIFIIVFANRIDSEWYIVEDIQVY